MRSRYLLPALLAGLGLALLVSLSSPAGEDVSAEKINKLIDQMGSGTFAEREKATKELEAIGLPALDALRKAAKSEDVEVRKRAGELAKKLEKQAASAKLLAAKRVHLVCKDMPVTDAVADLGKKSGYDIYLHDPEGKLKERKITLDTGETTFWHALALLCEKAELTETTMQELMRQGQPPFGGPGAPVPIRKPLPKPPVPAVPADQPPPAPPKKEPGLAAVTGALTVEVTAAAPPPAPPPPPPPLPGAGAAPVAVGVGVARGPFMPGMTATIVLKDGKAKKLPTDDRSAVRVRALPKADVFGDAAEGEILLALEATPEPRLQWQYLESVHIDKAIDDQDQKLTQVTPQVPAGPALPGAAVGGPPGGLRTPPRMPFRNGQFGQSIVVQLKKGDKASKSLKELSGTLTAHLLADAKPMITADNLAKAAGKTFKGDDGGSIKVIEVKTDEQKQTTIQFEFEQPPDTTPAAPQFLAGPMMRPAIRLQPPAGAPAPAPAPAPPAKKPGALAVGQVQAQIQIQGGGAVVGPGGAGGATFVGPINGLSIQDAKGNALPLQMGPQQFRVVGGGAANAFIATYTFLCTPGKDQGEPAKLVYHGRKSVQVDIPFTLKDVPLP